MTDYESLSLELGDRVAAHIQLAADEKLTPVAHATLRRLDEQLPERIFYGYYPARAEWRTRNYNPVSVTWYAGSLYTG